ncbi:septal ring lytic transglycosylase RlpA family protein [Sphingobacteriales bacterium UPWRP_1]|nr:septal ring lytic transglycosylase RlpA family protein [Sphingobacteriales bacterium UPWRP_1]
MKTHPCLMLYSLFSFLLFSSFSNNVEMVSWGVASYYSNSLSGKKTASGEKYNHNKLTAAHRTLPFGTKIKVSRIDNGKAVIVKVNDRGPYIKGRVVDLSKAAADKIGLTGVGKMQVKIEVIDNSNGVTLTEENLDELMQIIHEEEGW